MNLAYLGAAFALGLGLAVTSCRPAAQDYQDCVATAGVTSSGEATGKTEGERVTRCMEARGWHSLRPHSEPGPASWARVR